MTDPDTSGTPAAPAADNTAPAAPAVTAPASNAGGETQPFGTFGSTRGSGLNRGKKRPAAPASNPAPASTGGDYKPSSLEVITPKSEYKNPFAPEPEAPVIAPVSTPAPVETIAPAPAAAVFTPAPAPIAAPAPVVAPAPASVSSEKAELNILPPAEAKRPATSWEASSSDARPRREDRPTFRVEPRPGQARREEDSAKELYPMDAKPGRDAGREPRREGQRFEPREPRRDARPEQGHRLPAAASQPKRSGGFIAWLKGLFGFKSAAPASSHSGERHRESGEGGRDGYQGGRRRNRRGGRGRSQGGDRSGGYTPRAEGERSSGEGRGEFRGESRGEGRGDYRGGGEGHRGGGRSRGGRGRDRGERGPRGDRGGPDPRPEGQQGGGAI